MKVNENGEITIPKAICDQFGLAAGTSVEISMSKEGLLIKPSLSHREQVEKWMKDEHGHEIASLTTDQIMKLIQNG